MKAIKYLLVVVCFSAFGQKEIAILKSNNAVSDIIINNQKVVKMSSIQKNAFYDFNNTKTVFDSDKQRLEVWNGKEWINSVKDGCQAGDIAGPENDCGILGGGNDWIEAPVISANDTKICSSQNDINSNVITAVLTANGCEAGEGQHVAWYKENGTGIGNGSSHSITISNSGTYFARCITSGGVIKSSRSNYITITKYQTPVNSPILTPFLPIISGTSITLHAINCSPNNYEWENIGIGQNAIVLPLVTTTYRAFCENQSCRGDVSSVQVTVLQPTITANTNEICFDLNTGTSNGITLNVSNCGGSVVWSTGHVGTTLVLYPSSSFTISANCRLPNNLSIPTNFFNIFVTPKPTIAKTTLNRLEFRLTATCSLGNTFLWSTGATTSSIIVPSNVSEEYTVYCKQNGCLSIGTKKNIYAAPLISSNLNTICEGQTVTLSAEGCDGTIEWYSGTGTTVMGTNNPQNFTIRNILNPTVFTYRATCTLGQDTSPFSNIVSVNVNTGTAPTAPTVSSIPNPATINLGKSVSLTATGCAKNQTFWGTGDNVTAISKTPEETVTYFAYCFDGTCPSTIANKLVTVENVPPPTVTAAAAVVCAGQVAHLSISGCNGIATLWSLFENDLAGTPTSHGIGNVANIAISENRLFYANCAHHGVISDNSEMSLVSFSPNPIITTTPNPAALWEGESVELFASGCKSGETYVWDDLIITQTFSQTETQDIYHVAKCVNSNCTTNGVSVFVRVCPLLQIFTSPENDYKEPVFSQPDPSKVIIATNLIKNKNNGNVTKVDFMANNSINLEPGFNADLGTIFTAQIGGCTIR